MTLGTSCLEFIGLIASGGLRFASRIGNGLTQLARDLRVLAARQFAAVEQARED